MPCFGSRSLQKTTILILALPISPVMDHFDLALKLIAAGRLDEARIYLEELLRQDPDNPDLLYNLGLCYVDLGQLDQGIELLSHCLELAPRHSHACVALAVAYQKKGDLAQAREHIIHALAIDPKNPVALKNMGAILGREGDSLRALYFLRQSYQADPKDPQTVYGLAFAYMEMGDIEPAQRHFQMVLDMPASEELRALARNGLREIAVRELKARGPRMDAVFYLLDAMRLFAGKTMDEVREVAFEIGLQGQYGLDINDPKETHVLRSLPGRTFSALELLCIMYAGFKRIEPGIDIGMDLGEEWEMAERLSSDVI